MGLASQALTCADASGFVNSGAHRAKIVAATSRSCLPGRPGRGDLVEVLVPHNAAVFANPLDQAGAFGVMIEYLHELALPREPLIAPISQVVIKSLSHVGREETDVGGAYFGWLTAVHRSGPNFVVQPVRPARVREPLPPRRAQHGAAQRDETSLLALALVSEKGFERKEQVQQSDSPVTARPISMRWISDVPSKMVKILV
jgi:hypothetical protein